MTSRRRSSIGGFHKITIQKTKFKDSEIDVIDYRKLKEEPLSDGEEFKEEYKNKNQKTKGQENYLNKITSGKISKYGSSKYETNFAMGDARSNCSDDDLKDFTSDVPYKSNFEDASRIKDDADKKKQMKTFSAQFLGKKEGKNSVLHSKSSKSKMGEEPSKCEVSKNKKNQMDLKQSSSQKALKNRINEVVSVSAECKNNSLLVKGHSENEPVEEGNIDIFKCERIKRNDIIKSKTKMEDKNTGSKANLHIVTKAPKFEDEGKKNKQDNKSKKLHKEVNNGEMSEDGKLRHGAEKSQRLQNLRRSERIASLTRVCYKEISLFKGK